jgi:hypothetical protein
MHVPDPDGHRLVILREHPNPFGARYEVLESGVVQREGETLWLTGQDGAARDLSHFETTRMLYVTPYNRIPECTGFSFFLLHRED